MTNRGYEVDGYGRRWWRRHARHGLADAHDGRGPIIGEKSCGQMRLSKRRRAWGRIICITITYTGAMKHVHGVVCRVVCSMLRDHWSHKSGSSSRRTT